MSSLLGEHRRGHQSCRSSESTCRVTDNYEYDSYGNFLGSTGSTANVYYYQGQQFDIETGLYYLRARYYNPVTGRFSSTDPVTENHPYSYAGADPIDKDDPTGTELAFISIEAQLLTGLAAQLTPSAPLRTNFGLKRTR